MISLITNYIHFYNVIIGYNSVPYDIRKYSKYHHNKNNNNKTNKQTKKWIVKDEEKILKNLENN